MTPIAASVMYGIAAAIGWGVADMLAAAASKRLGPLPAAAAVHIASVLAALPYFLWIAADAPALTAVHWALIAGVSALGVLMYIAFYRALQAGPVAVVSPIVSAYALIVIALAVVFLGERLNAAQIAAATLCVGGAALASVNPSRGGGAGRLIGLGALLALITALCIGVWQYAVGVLSRELGWFIPIYFSRAITLAMLAPLALSATSRRGWRALTLPIAAAALLAGVIETAGLFAFARGAEVGVISIVAAASIAYPAIPIVGGIVFFKERLAPIQFVGVAAVIGGLFALALAS